MRSFTLKEFNDRKLLPFIIMDKESWIRIEYVEYDCRIFFKTIIGFQCYFIN
jgi:hypothetical protein